MKYNPLEKDILNWFINVVDDKNLRHQLSRSVLRERKYTGVGFFLALEVPGDVSIIRGMEQDITPVPGPYIESPELSAGGDTVLFINDGIIETIEIFSYGNMFPEFIKNYQLCSPTQNSSV